jgi:uncharacterized protein YjbI with pentapeptide repeats
MVHEMTEPRATQTEIRDNRGNVLARVDGSTLRGASLAFQNLKGAQLSGADLRDADLTGTNLSEADLTGADLRGAKMNGLVVEAAQLKRVDASGSQFLERASFRNAVLDRAVLRNCKFDQADLTGAQLLRSDLSQAVLSNCALDGASLTGSNLAGATVVNCTLDATNLCGSDLSSASLSSLRYGQGAHFDRSTRWPPLSPQVLAANGWWFFLWTPLLPVWCAAFFPYSGNWSFVAIATLVALIAIAVRLSCRLFWKDCGLDQLTSGPDPGSWSLLPSSSTRSLLVSGITVITVSTILVSLLGFKWTLLQRTSLWIMAGSLFVVVVSFVGLNEEPVPASPPHRGFWPRPRWLWSILSAIVLLLSIPSAFAIDGWFSATIVAPILSILIRLGWAATAYLIWCMYAEDLRKFFDRLKSPYPLGEVTGLTAILTIMVTALGVAMPTAEPVITENSTSQPAKENPTCEYWISLRKEYQSLNQVFTSLSGKTDPMESVKQVNRAIGQVEAIRRRLAELPVVGIDDDAIALTHSFAVITSRAVELLNEIVALHRRNDELGERASSADFYLETFVRGIFGQPLNGADEVKAFRNEADRERQRILREAQEFQRDRNEFQVKSMQVRALLSKRIGHDLPSLIE